MSSSAHDVSFFLVIVPLRILHPIGATKFIGWKWLIKYGISILFSMLVHMIFLVNLDMVIVNVLDFRRHVVCVFDINMVFQFVLVIAA